MTIHGSVIAGEYSIPAVVDIENATNIKRWTYVLVDGKGSLYRLSGEKTNQLTLIKY